MEESAIFDSVVDIITRGGYDYYIYDLVPLGHALYYLSMSKVYDAWINKIAMLRQKMEKYDKVIATTQRRKEIAEDKILKELSYIKERINTSSKIFTDPKMTAFFFVLTPEEMTILDTIKANALFLKFNVPIRGFIVNRVIPPKLAGENIPPYLKNRIEMQKNLLSRIKEEFKGGVLGYIPEMERDIRGLDMIEKIKGEMFRDE